MFVPKDVNTAAHASRVVIVDDDEDVRTALESLVESMGHEARGFASADALFGSPLLDDADCVITDLQMQGMTGLDLARRLRDAAGPPVILVTAFPAVGIARPARQAEVRCFLRKPLDPLKLIDALARILNGDPRPCGTLA